ncbi:hypothetical protein [Streptomyces sp. NBC_00645]|uniref:hypothetical protein n=1 Tax=Streptomyces sp. NBC_00645 TaxID=2975795 RepID=UPI00324567B8
MTSRPTLRRALRAGAFALTVSSAALGALASAVVPAHALPTGHPLAHTAAAEECAPDDQACKDQQANADEAKKIEEEQKKTQEAAGKAEQTISDVGKKIDECPPGSSACMEKLTGSGTAEKDGITAMTGTISGFQTEPAGNAGAAVTSTCTDFPASLPQGSTTPGQSPFPVAQLCSLLGS